MTGIVVVLASASPARRVILRQAGIEPVVEVSRVDESQVQDKDPARLAGTLARLKGEDVVRRLAAQSAEATETIAARRLVIGCDSVLAVDGVGFGKPGTPDIAAERLRNLRGRSAILHTGHHLTELATGICVAETASTTVEFGWFTDQEIDAYVATGEPLNVAGAFTIDGIGGAYVNRVIGDPSNVVGLSLPLMRRLVANLGIQWHQLWNR